jgi:DNA mismatch endonuclease (patch repair protein)
MSRIRGKNTKPELALFELVKPLWHVCRYRKHHPSLPGTLFLWMGPFGMEDYSEKSDRWTPMWKDKILGNMLRDIKVNEELASKGYRVLRFWDREVLREGQFVYSTIEAELLESLY